MPFFVARAPVRSGRVSEAILRSRADLGEEPRMGRLGAWSKRERRTVFLMVRIVRICWRGKETEVEGAWRAGANKERREHCEKGALGGMVVVVYTQFL